jgi:hypothetical protein
VLGAALNRCLESVIITPHAHAPQVCVAMLHGMNGMIIGPHRERRRMSASRYVPISSWDNPRHRVGTATLRIGTGRSIQNDPDRFTCDRFHGRRQFRRHDLSGVRKVERILEQFQNNSSYGQVTKTLPGATPLQRHHRFQATENQICPGTGLCHASPSDRTDGVACRFWASCTSGESSAWCKFTRNAWDLSQFLGLLLKVGGITQVSVPSLC